MVSKYDFSLHLVGREETQLKAHQSLKYNIRRKIFCYRSRPRDQCIRTVSSPTFVQACSNDFASIDDILGGTRKQRLPRSRKIQPILSRVTKGSKQFVAMNIEIVGDIFVSPLFPSKRHALSIGRVNNGAYVATGEQIAGLSRGRTVIVVISWTCCGPT